MATSEAKKAYLRDYYARNREAIRARQAAYESDNREAIAAQQKEYYAANRDACLARMAAYQAAHPGYRKAYNDAYYELEKARFVERARQRQQHIARRATPAWADPQAMNEIYADAARLTDETGIDHEVDHIVPLKHPLVCGLHVEANLQILTRAENRAKRNSFNLGS